MGERRCYALLIAYDGGAFAGFQRQPPLQTVQGALEEAFASLGWPCRIESGGRTDRGVHACRQIVACRIREALPVDALPALLAPHLPPALLVLDAREAPASFHPRFSSISKRYRYLVTTAPAPTEAQRRSCWVLPDPRGFPAVAAVERLDEKAMRRVLAALQGPHDFGLIAHPKAEGKRRRVLGRAELEVREEAGGGATYALHFAASGFIRHQIRNMVGMVVSAGLGRLEQGEVERLLRGEGERWRGPRAPGWGLSLLEVGYRAGENPFRGEGS